MPATVTREPVCARPAKPPAAPERCLRCKGAGADPEAAGACERCAGGGWEAARFDLAPSRTHELRRCQFWPRADGTGRLLVWMLRRKTGWKVWPEPAEYAVREFPCDFDGRAFRLEKLGTERKHDLFIGADGSAACHCEGETFLSAAKADQKAHERGERVFGSKGCVHLDATSCLLAAGWLDLPSGG